MTELRLDLETFSRADLKKSGLAAYAEHESTDILCACWAFDGGPVSAWIPTGDAAFAESLRAHYPFESIFVGTTPPEVVCNHISEGGKLVAWNTAFERTVLNGTAGRRYGIPLIKIEQTRCSMANARVHGLPGALEDAANAINAAVKKRVAGVNAMRYLCKPRKDGTRPTIVEERARFMELVPYCGDDVAAERAVDDLLPPMTPAEHEVYIIDQEMNDRGILVDLTSVDNMEILIQKRKYELKTLCKKMTGFAPTQTGQVAAWIRSHGYPELENLQKDTIRKALLTDIPSDVKTVLKLYSTYNMKAIAKFPAMRKAVCRDGRIRHMFLYYGASTGRWSSLIVQLQNLFRPVIDDQDSAIAAAEEWDIDWLRVLWPKTDPMKVIASTVRGHLIAPPGKELMFPDFAGVEARWNAWMFDEAWKLQAFRDYDAGIGHNVYVVTYSKCFNVDPASNEAKGGKQIGKVLDLSMGYEGGVGAFVKMAGNYQIDLKTMTDAAYHTLPRDILDESMEAYAYAMEQGRLYDLPERVWVTCEGLKRLWRRAHPGIVKGWDQLKQAALKAVANPGQIHAVADKRIMYKTELDWLVMRLPSGRKIWYYQPKIKTDAKGKETLYYYGINTTTRQWGLTSTYGGKQCENETQAGCRCLLVFAKRGLRAAGYPIIGSVHDQPILEVGPEHSTELATEIMCRIPGWATGLPLAVENVRARRFRK